MFNRNRSPEPGQKLALHYDGKDRWYLEALGIAAEGHWDECLAEWFKLNGRNLKGRAAQDIIWRSRSSQTAQLLADAIGDPETVSDELPRLFRGLDFQKGPGAEKAIAALAFQPQKGNEARQTLIAAEAISRVKGGDVSSNPQMKASLDRILAKNAGSVQFVRLVGQFNLTDRIPELIALCQANPESQASVEAVKMLVDKANGDLLKQALADPDVAKVTALLKAIAAAKENKSTALLLPLLRDKARGDAVRREVVAALAASRAGSKQLATLAEENKYDPSLKEALAAALHASPIARPGPWPKSCFRFPRGRTTSLSHRCRNWPPARGTSPMDASCSTRRGPACSVTR